MAQFSFLVLVALVAVASAFPNDDAECFFANENAERTELCAAGDLECVKKYIKPSENCQSLGEASDSVFSDYLRIPIPAARAIFQKTNCSTGGLNSAKILGLSTYPERDLTVLSLAYENFAIDSRLEVTYYRPDNLPVNFAANTEDLYPTLQYTIVFEGSETIDSSKYYAFANMTSDPQNTFEECVTSSTDPGVLEFLTTLIAGLTIGNYEQFEVFSPLVADHFVNNYLCWN